MSFAMASNASTPPLAQAALRRYRSDLPRSSSMYDTSESSKFLNELFPMVQAQSKGNSLSETESPFSPYLLAISSDLTPFSLDSKPRATKAAKLAHPPSSFHPTSDRVVSQLYRHSSQTNITTNPDVERILAKPSLIRGSPRPRASTVDPLTQRPTVPNLGQQSQLATDTAGRSTFYQSFAKSQAPFLPPPGESRRAVPPRVFGKRSVSRVESGNTLLQSGGQLKSTSSAVRTSLLLFNDLAPRPIPKLSSSDEITPEPTTAPLRLDENYCKTSGSMRENPPKNAAPSRQNHAVLPDKRQLKQENRRFCVDPVPRPLTSVSSNLNRTTDEISLSAPLKEVQSSIPPSSQSLSKQVSPRGAANPSSTESSKKKRQSVPPPLLIIQSSPWVSRRHSRSSSLDPPLSPVSTVSTLAPIIFQKKAVSEKELRRRRFQKLTRTLGEQIPLDLLLNTSPSPSPPISISHFDLDTKKEGRRSRGNTKSRRRVSVSFPMLNPSPKMLTHFPLSTPLEVPASAKPRTPSPIPNLLKKQVTTRRNYMEPIAVSEDVQVEGKALPQAIHLSPINVVNAVPYFESHPFRLVVEDLDSSLPEDNSGVPLCEMARLCAPFSAVLDTPQSSDAPFVDSAITIQQRYLTLPDMGDPRGVYRKEKRQGWSGEWNQPHIQDVIEKLRNL